MDVDSFVRDGFVPVRRAVDTGAAAVCWELIWQSITRRGLRRPDPATWPSLVRIDDLGAAPFTAAGLSPKPTAAYDELIGPGRWSSPVAVGRAVMVRFPSEDRAGDGYHIEASYPGPGRPGLAGSRVPAHHGHHARPLPARRPRPPASDATHRPVKLPFQASRACRTVPRYMLAPDAYPIKYLDREIRAKPRSG